jgi:hypothetical protein
MWALILEFRIRCLLSSCECRVNCMEVKLGCCEGGKDEERETEVEFKQVK